MISLVHPDLDESLDHVRDPGVDGRVRVHAVGEQEARVIGLTTCTLGHDLGERDAGSRLDLPEPQQARGRVERLKCQCLRRLERTHGELAGSARHTDSESRDLRRPVGREHHRLGGGGLVNAVRRDLRDAVRTVVGALDPPHPAGDGGPRHGGGGSSDDEAEVPCADRELVDVGGGGDCRNLADARGHADLVDLTEHREDGAGDVAQ